MPCGFDWGFSRPNPAYMKAVKAWTKYYHNRGVSFGRDHELAEKKCRNRIVMPPL